MLQALKRFDPYKLLIHDIETVRCFENLPIDTRDPCHQAWAYGRRKHDETNYYELNASYRDLASLSPEFARVACVSVGIIRPDSTIEYWYFNDADESVLLTQFNEYLSLADRFVLAGFSIGGFDIPFLCKRNIINGLEPSPKLDLGDRKPWEKNICDLYDIWKMGGYRSGNLTEICYALGVKSSKSDEIDGSKVGDIYYQPEQTPGDNIGIITSYCNRDIFVTGELLIKLFNLPPQTNPYLQSYVHFNHFANSSKQLSAFTCPSELVYPID
jgi:3'-5' exonuclease